MEISLTLSARVFTNADILAAEGVNTLTWGRLQKNHNGDNDCVLTCWFNEAGEALTLGTDQVARSATRLAIQSAGKRAAEDALRELGYAPAI